jgi:outer membrane immunogenic protein
MKKLATIIAAITLTGTPALAADVAVKAPPPGAALVAGWTGFYSGIQVGGGWSSDQGVNFSANDPAAAQLLNGTGGFSAGEQPLVGSYGISQSGAVGGFEAGYNWQGGSNWLLGLETDFSFSGMRGQAGGPASTLVSSLTTITQSTTAQQRTDWYGTVQGRAGYLATPKLLLFATGGFAYGRVADSASYLINSATPSTVFTNAGGFGYTCNNGVPCFAGSSSAIRTGWTAGGGVEWLFDQHWSAKIEYQFVDLGTDTVRVTALAVPNPVFAPASFNTAFRDQFNVVRVGLNYQFH